MGAALEWLGPDGCRRAAEQILTVLNAVDGKGELWAACPWHTETSVGSAFSYNYMTDSAHCFSCGEGGDLIAVYGALFGLDDKAAFRQFKAQFAAAAVLTAHTPTSPVRPVWTPRRADPSPSLWQQKATDFVSHSEERLHADPALLQQLAAWGLSPEAARACRIGWNDKDKSVPRTAWGLPPLVQNEKEKKIWLPQGLVFPFFQAGRVVRIKIRRPAAATSWGADLRYWEVPGSTKVFHRCGRDCGAWVVVETERDANMVWWHVRDQGVGAMATGGATKRPDADSDALLRGSLIVLNALDLDQAGMINAVRFWEREYPQHRRWPTPMATGKDAGEAFGNGLDIRAWVLAGLPAYVQRELACRKRQASQAACPCPPSPVFDPLPSPSPRTDMDLPTDYREIMDELVRLVRVPVTVDGEQLIAQAPASWSATRERWSMLLRIDALLRTDAGMDMIIETGVKKHTRHEDFLNARTCLLRWFEK